jgi:hypothetical protein
MLQPDHWIMVREDGKPAVKCRVVSTKKQKDGSTLCQAKTESGESITLLEETVKGMPSGTMRMRVLAGNDCTTCGPVPSVVTPPAETHPLIGPTPTGATPALKPVPPPTVLPAAQAKPENTSLFGKLFHSTPSKPEVEKKEVVQAKPEVKPEPKKESISAIGRFFLSTPAKPEVAKATDKQSPVVNVAGSVAVSESRPQLPISTTIKDDPLSRPDLYTKNPLAAPSLPAPPKPSIMGRIFDRGEPTVVTTPVDLKVGATPAPVVSVPITPVPKATVVQESKETAPSLLDRLRTQTVVQESKESAPSFLDRLRSPVVSAPAKPVATPGEPRRVLPTGYGSVVATRDRAIMAQSAGGAMVRTPTGAMAYVPPDQMPHGPNVMPVSASNAFTLAMPGFAPGMAGSMPMMALQQASVSYDRGVPEGAANAFTMTSTSRPVPADFGPPHQYPNAFMMDGMGGAYTRPMALAYDPRMGYIPVGGGYPQQHPMLPMPHPAGQMLATLHGSMLPSERERAVVMLSQCNWHAEPEAVAAIVNAAKSDPAPAVRVSCVRALARMKVATMPVYETLQELKTDKDIRVRQEAEQTLATMTKH